MKVDETQGTLFDQRFLGRHAGQIMSDPTTALVELVANAWDAYATEVNIIWPDAKSKTPFSITDNGIGMTAEEFSLRWRTIDYDRTTSQGEKVPPPSELKNALPRLAYGRNGRGRHAAFLFSSPYRVKTWRDGSENTFIVNKGSNEPISISLETTLKADGHGTKIFAHSAISSNLESSDVRELLSTRFLMDPSFSVIVDGIQVSFDDIPNEAISTIDVEVNEYGTAKVLVIDSLRADRTTKQHGIAWWVKRRLVGRSGWDTFNQKLIDGRTEEAKRYSFIIHADFLQPSVKPDWSGFQNDARWAETQSKVFEEIQSSLFDLLKEKRSETRDAIIEEHKSKVKNLPILSRDRWNGMLDRLVEQCPTLGEQQLSQIMDILATLELSNSQYTLLNKLHDFSPSDFDAWNSILEEWSVKTAKEALDEIARRLKLIEEIRHKTSQKGTDEVQELQPLFGQALWIFGPQFESIDFTSNRGMTTVIREIFGAKDQGSLNRPDFFVRPDSSTVGFYARPSFDENFNENGTETLVVVELKSPGVPIGSDEKNQVWKYIKELKNKGYISDNTYVHGFALGDRIERNEGSPRTEGDRIAIYPMLYNSFIGNAEKRMLNLHRRIADAPFLKAIIEQQETAKLKDQQPLFNTKP